MNTQLVVTLARNGCVRIGDDIEVQVASMNCSGQVKLVIRAPRNIRIHRTEEIQHQVVPKAAKPLSELEETLQMVREAANH